MTEATPALLQANRAGRTHSPSFPRRTGERAPSVSPRVRCWMSPGMRQTRKQPHRVESEEGTWGAPPERRSPLKAAGAPRHQDGSAPGSHGHEEGDGLALAARGSPPREQTRGARVRLAPLLMTCSLHHEEVLKAPKCFLRPPCWISLLRLRWRKPHLTLAFPVSPVPSRPWDT